MSWDTDSEAEETAREDSSADSLALATCCFEDEKSELADASELASDADSDLVELLRLELRLALKELEPELESEELELELELSLLELPLPELPDELPDELEPEYQLLLG